MTIEAAPVKMYVKPKALKYVPSPLYNREVTFTYKALELGVFIIDTNDNLINKDSWSPTMQQTTVGVALITEKVAIVIATGLHTDLCWSKTNQLQQQLILRWLQQIIKAKPIQKRLEKHWVKMRQLHITALPIPLKMARKGI